MKRAAMLLLLLLGAALPGCRPKTQPNDPQLWVPRGGAYTTALSGVRSAEGTVWIEPGRAPRGARTDEASEVWSERGSTHPGTRSDERSEVWVERDP